MKHLRKIPHVSLIVLASLAMTLAIVTVSKLSVKAQNVSANEIWSDAGIGALGSFQEDASGVFAVADTGADLWGTNDAFHFVYQPLNGNGQITARILGMNGTNAWAKAGVMVRETLSANSRYAMKLMSAGNGAYFQWRSVDGSETVFGLGDTNASLPCWVRLVKNGDWIGTYSSSDGVNWTLTDWQLLNGLAQQVYVGLAYCSHDAQGGASTAWFDQVSILPADMTQVMTPAAGTGDGLAATYYNNRHLWGPPVASWVDPNIDFGYDDLAKKGSGRTDEFGIRWTGELEAAFTEPYTFYVYRDDGVRVWLNEQLIIDAWNAHHAVEEQSAPINLVAGQHYLLRVEYFQNHGGADVSLRWSSLSTPKQVIPQSQLYSKPVDSAGSGLPDLWQLLYFGQIGVAPNADPDGDGLSNLQEYQKHSDPTSSLFWGVPNEWTHGDIEDWGGSQGNASYNNGAFTLTSSTTNQSEHIHYLYQPIGTNGELVARLLNINGVNNARVGLMLHESLDSQARFLMLPMTPSNGMAFPLREAVGAQIFQGMQITNPPLPCWLKVVRNNDWLGGYVSADGTNWGLFDWEFIKGLAPQAFIGLAVISQCPAMMSNTTTMAQFDHVHLGPASPSEILTPVEGNGDGLLASYRNDSLLYLPGLTNRVEPEVDYYFVHGPPFDCLNPDSYGACWSGELQAQFTEPYQFSLECRRENWVRVWLNDQLIIDGWRKWHPDYKVYSAPINLVAGQHYLIRVEMYDNSGQGVSILRWTSPSTPEHFISQSQLYSQPAMDPSGNGLPVIWEQIYFGHTNVDPNADPDGDGLSNLQEYHYHTNPLRADADGDGIPDAWEIAHGLDPQYAGDASLDYDNSGLNNLQKYQYGLDPLNPDQNGDGLPDAFEEQYLGTGPSLICTNQVSVAASANGLQATNFLGQWQLDGTDIYCLNRRGGLDFNLTVTNANKYVLNLIGTQNYPNPFETKHKLLLGIDGQTLGHYWLNAGFGTNNTVEVVLPYLQAGSHTLHVFWDGRANFSHLRIKQVNLLAVSGAATNQTGLKDWVLNMIHSESGFDSTNNVIGSYTSPAFLEGRDPYPVFTTMTNYLTNGLSQQWTTDNRWYLNMPFMGSTQAVLNASYQNGAVSDTRQLQWLQVNLLTAANMTVRLGDSLLLNAFPANGANGNTQIIIGTNTFTSKTLKPVPYRFTAPGLYTVTGTYTSTTGSSQSGGITVDVVQDNFPNVQPAAWTGQARTLNLVVPTEAVLQSDSRLACFVSATNGSNRVQLTLGNAANEPRSIIARLGNRGPIMDSTQVSGFDFCTPAFRVVQQYPDGSQMIEMLMVSSPVETNVTFTAYVVAGGITFDDGTTIKTFTSTNFNALGLCPVRFIRPASAGTGVCNMILMGQGNYQIGYLH